MNKKKRPRVEGLACLGADPPRSTRSRAIVTPVVREDDGGDNPFFKKTLQPTTRRGGKSDAIRTPEIQNNDAPSPGFSSLWKSLTQETPAPTERRDPFGESFKRFSTNQDQDDETSKIAKKAKTGNSGDSTVAINIENSEEDSVSLGKRKKATATTPSPKKKAVFDTDNEQTTKKNAHKDNKSQSNPNIHLEMQISNRTDTNNYSEHNEKEKDNGAPYNTGIINPALPPTHVPPTPALPSVPPLAVPPTAHTARNAQNEENPFVAPRPRPIRPPYGYRPPGGYIRPTLPLMHRGTPHIETRPPAPSTPHMNGAYPLRTGSSGVKNKDDIVGKGSTEFKKRNRAAAQRHREKKKEQFEILTQENEIYKEKLKEIKQIIEAHRVTCEWDIDLEKLFYVELPTPAI